jgi:conjugative transfer signal peptidase TraF
MKSQDKRRRALRIVLIGLVPVATAAAVAAALPGPIVIHNPSPSIPQGYYVRSSEAPATGRIIAFRIPAQGRPYAAEHMPPLIRAGIIKRIAAGEGDRVCTTGREGLAINGRAVAPIVQADRFGRPLPHWRGCRALTAGEYFVFSDRIPNSYDSRYYGPVQTRDIIGTFRPVWVDQSKPDHGRI